MRVQPMLQCRPMPLESPPESSAYRVTLFFGPEPVHERPDAVACVFNVKKRSWKAGIQVSVEIGKSQLSAIERSLQLTNRLSHALGPLDPEQRVEYETRVPDLLAQAVSWCKLDLRLHSGLTQENQRLASDELDAELNQAVLARKEYVLSYILTELDLAHDNSSPSSR